MPDNRTVSLAFRVKPDKARALEKLSASTDRPKSWLLERALDEYLRSQAWQIVHIQEGIADADAGRMTPHAEVRDWLLSWGRDNEAKPPV